MNRRKLIKNKRVFNIELSFVAFSDEEIAEWVEQTKKNNPFGDFRDTVCVYTVTAERYGRRMFSTSIKEL